MAKSFDVQTFAIAGRAVAMRFKPKAFLLIQRVALGLKPGLQPIWVQIRKTRNLSK